MSTALMQWTSVLKIGMGLFRLLMVLSGTCPSVVILAFVVLFFLTRVPVVIGLGIGS